MRRPFVVIGGCFLGAAYLASLFSFRIQAGCLASCILLFFLGLCFARGEARQAVCLGSCAAALAFGLFAGAVRGEERVLALDGTEQTVTVEVLRAERRDNGGYTYEAVVEAGAEPGVPAFRILLYAGRSLGVEEYGKAALKVRFARPGSTGYFDSARYYRSGRVFLLGYADWEGPVRTEPAERVPALGLVRELNRSLAARAEEMMPPQAAAVFQSMLLGSREGIDPALEQRYTDAGVVHLLAISGLHVSALAGFAVWAQRLLRLRGRGWVLFRMGLVAGFLLLSGCPLSALRAGGMILLMLAGQLFRRRSESVNSLCCAGFFIVLSDIYAIMDVGFQMSFLATLGIVTCAGPMQRRLCARLRIVSPRWSAVVGTGCVTTAANLFLMPVYLGAFSTFSVVGPVANLLTAAPSFLVIAVGFLLLAVWLLPAQGLLPLVLARAESGLILLQNRIAEWLGGLPFASIGLDHDLMQFWFAASLLAAGAALLLKRRMRLARPAAAFSAALFLLCHALILATGRDTLRLTVLGDGEAANVALIDRFEAVVISTGDDDWIDEMTGRYLKQLGVRRIRALILLEDGFAEYRDTLALMGMLPVETVFCRRGNTACVQILESLGRDVRLLKPASRWESEEGLALEVYDRGELAEMRLDCGGVRVLLSGRAGPFLEQEADLVLFSGETGDLGGCSGGEIVLLREQKERITARQPLLRAEEAPLEYEIVSGETLRRMD